MALILRRLFLRMFGLTLFLGVVSVAMPVGVTAAVEDEPAVIIYPGLNEVVPKSTAVAVRLEDAELKVSQAEDLGAIYAELDAQLTSLKTLETQYSPWEEISDWKLNALLMAKDSYTDLKDQQQKQLDVIYLHLKDLEELRSSWGEEKVYWQKWRDSFLKAKVKIPKKSFSQTIENIDRILKEITRIVEHLITAQQKYSPAQEIIASRLSLLDKNLDTLRLNSFQRNAYSFFEVDFYRQFNHEIWTDSTKSFVEFIRLPKDFFQRYGQAIGLQAFSSSAICLLFLYWKKKKKTLAGEWIILIRRPIAGGIFLSTLSIGTLIDVYSSMPQLWRWLLLMVLAIATARLLNALFDQPHLRSLVRIIAGLFMLTGSIQAIGLPTPLMQLYQATLCICVFWGCQALVRKWHERLVKQKVVLNSVYAVSLFGFTGTIFGFETFTANLIDVTLNTFILIVLTKMTLRLTDAGMQSLMQWEWISNRHFMQHLGLEETTKRLQNLLKTVILSAAGLFLLVNWKLFDNIAAALNALLGFEFTFGEFHFSVKMVVMMIIVLYLTMYLSWGIQAFADSQIMTPRKMERGVKESLKRLVHYALFTIGFVTAVSMAGLDMQKFTILAGALGVGIGFGLQNIINNFVSGLILLFERPVKIGDTITIDQEWGTITRIGLRSTVVETFDRSEIIVPNADLIAQKVTNWTFSSKVARLILPVGVAYGSSLKKVLEVLEKVPKDHPEVLSYPKPTAIFIGFGDSSIDFELRVWIRNIEDRLKIRSELGIIVDSFFREEGIEIPFPQRDLHLRSVDHAVLARVVKTS